MRQDKIRHDRIKQLREALRLDQGTVAYRAGVDVSYVYRLEQGKNPNVSAVILAAIARALRTNTDYLVGSGDDPTGRSLSLNIAENTKKSDTVLGGFDPEVAALVGRLEALGQSARDKIMAIIAAVLDLLGVPDVDEDAELSEAERELVGYLRKASPEKRIEIRMWLAAKVADREGQTAEH